MNRAFLPLLFLLMGCSGCCRDDKAADNRSIVVIYDNDVHCAIDAYPKYAGYRDAITAADTSYVLTVSCGDYLQGGMAGLFSQGEFPLEIVNSVGYDAVTVGNHEFDYRIPRFRELTAGINAPVVCVNLTETDGTRLFRPYVIKRCGSRSIAFVGVLTPVAIEAESYAFIGDDGNLLLELNEDNIIPMVQNAVDDARREGADYVVVLSHLGEMKPSVTSRDLIAATRGIDVLLDGHSHSTFAQETVMNMDGKPVITSQTGTGFVNLGKLIIRPDGRISTELVPIETINLTSEKVSHTVDSVKALYEELAQQKIGTCEKTLTIYDDDGTRIVRNRECSMGNFVADAYRAVCNAQIAFVNGGGVRTVLKAGDITFQDIIDIQPFGNTIVLVRCKGSGIVSMLEKCSASYPDEDGSFSQVSGMRYTIDSGHGNKVTDVQVLDPRTGQYTPMLPDAIYTVAASDYSISLFEEQLGGTEYLNAAVMTDYEACIKYISEILHGTVGAGFADLQGRITIR